MTIVRARYHKTNKYQFNCSQILQQAPQLFMAKYHKERKMEIVQAREVTSKFHWASA